MLLALAILYALVVIADVWTTIKAVRLVRTKEINILLRPIVHKPVLFISVELALYAAFVGWLVYWHSFRAGRMDAIIMLAAACVVRGLVVANNVRVLRRAK
jgi:uncharacterized membrane protein